MTDQDRHRVLGDLFDRLGVLPADQTDRLHTLADTALTHRSYAAEARDRGETCPDNERLEFLGNYVLDFLIAELLYHAHPEAEPGELNARISVTENRNLASIARRRWPGVIDGALRLGRGQAVTDSIRADALEAVIGAVYLACGLAATRRVVTAIFAEELRRHRTGANYKGRLQELVRTRDLSLSYEVRQIGGTDDRPVWRAEAMIGGRVRGCGEGRSRRLAEQRAAREALGSLDP